ncbi:MAG: twin-arginine translocation signal domain-containing protein, partial [Bacteroidetes bacterium]|nr:twin-arginine translocation signal domain-containing protein [Bacteroidota bacterium]
MKKNSGRRDFLKNVTLGSAAALMPSPLVKMVNEGKTTDGKNETIQPAKRSYNSVYTGEYLDRIAFPIGGIGAGMFCLEGTGSIAQVSVRNRPEMFSDPGIF